MLNKHQWLRASAQIMAAIQRGLYQSFPLESTETFVRDLGPEGDAATRVFCEASASIAYFLTHPPTTAESSQCARCLEVSSSTVTGETWEATLRTCNRDADVARLTIINATIRESRKNGELWRQKTREMAKDRVVLGLTSEHLPHVKADPRVLEWISRQAADLKEEAEKDASMKAAEDARAIYEQQYDITRHALEEDLHKIRLHHDTLLAKAREDAANDLAALKAKFKTEKAQTRIDLEQQERQLGKVEKRKNPRPSPISVKPRKERQRASRDPSPAGSRAPSPSPSLEYTDAPVVPMNTDTAEGNSPTPKADASLAPQVEPLPTPAATDSASILQAIIAHLDKKIDPITRRLSALEDARTQPQTLDDGHNYMWGQPEYDHRSEDDTPEQNEMLKRQREIAEHAGQFHYDANNRITPGPDPAHFVPDPEFDALAEYHARQEQHADNPGRIDDDNDDIMTDADDIDDNESVDTPEKHIHFGPELVAAGRAAIAQDDADRASRRRPFAPGIIQLGPKIPTGQGRASQPISVNSSYPPSQTNNTANTQSYAATAGTDGSVWKIVGKKTSPRRNNPNATPAPRPVNQTEATRPYSIDKLKTSTKPNIIAHAQLAFGKRLSTRMKKDQLIVAYQQAQADAAKNPSKPTDPNNGRQRIANTTEWTISRKQNTETINFTRPFNGDPVRLVQHIQTALRQNSALPDPPLTLVAGRWSSGLTSNFVLTFAGRLSTKLVETHKPTLMEKFPAIFDLFCNEGLRKYVVLGVPMVRDAEGRLPTQQQLYYEFARNNPHYQQWGLPIKPVWARSSLLDHTRESLSFTFLLSDPDNTSNRILRSPCYMFGKPCTVKKANSFTQHRQCTRCFLLTHNADTYPRSAEYKCCGICGASGHTKSEHGSAHCRRPHATIQCDCPPTCFNCRFRKLPTAGHYAFSDECPLKKNMRRLASAPPAPQARTPAMPAVSTAPAPPNSL
jgi:hypothetical protein